MKGIGAGRWASVYTSDHVLAETLNYLRVKAPHPDHVEAVLELVFGREGMDPIVADVMRVHSGRFARTQELFRERFDQGLSFTDWTNVVCMQEEGIGTIATVDEGFEGIVERVLLLGDGGS